MQEIQDKGQKVEQFRQQATQDLQRQNEQLMAPILQKITEAIKSVGQEGSFTFIFPNEPSLLLYQGTDVTDVTPSSRQSSASNKLTTRYKKEIANAISFFMPYDNHGVQMVHPWGVEPQSSEPESEILSIELRVHGFGSANVRLFCIFAKI